MRCTWPEPRSPETAGIFRRKVKVGNFGRLPGKGCHLITLPIPTDHSPCYVADRTLCIRSERLVSHSNRCVGIVVDLIGHDVDLLDVTDAHGCVDVIHSDIWPAVH